MSRTANKQNLLTQDFAEFSLPLTHSWQLSRRWQLPQPSFYAKKNKQSPAELQRHISCLRKTAGSQHGDLGWELVTAADHSPSWLMHGGTGFSWDATPSSLTGQMWGKDKDSAGTRRGSCGECPHILYKLYAGWLRGTGPPFIIWISIYCFHNVALS